MVTGQLALRDQLVAMVPRGPLRQDEAALVRTASELALRQYFPPGYDVPTVTAFAQAVRQLLPGTLGLGVMDSERVIRARLGETDVDLSGISAQGALEVLTMAFAYTLKLLEWEEPAIDDLVAKAEVKVIKDGWKPQLIPAGWKPSAS